MKIPAAFLLVTFIVPSMLLAAGESPRGEGAKVELVSADFQLADGPAWDGSFALYVPDVRAKQIKRFVPRRMEVQPFRLDIGTISASYYNHGQLYVSDNGRSRIAVLKEGTLVALSQEDLQATPPARPNDLVVDSRGGLFYTLTRQNQVIYVSPGGTRQVAVEKIETPNGIIISPDGRTLYVASYVPKKIWAYPLEYGQDELQVGGGRMLAGMDDGPVKGADGMTVDRAGNIYCAGPADIWIWNPAGKLLDKIPVPTRPINCVFGDGDMRTLYITGFGGLYRVRMRINGRSPHPPSAVDLQSTNPNRPPTTLPAGVRADLDVVYAQYGHRTLLADLFEPAARTGKAPGAAIVVVHGGGWLNGDKTKFRALSVELARRGYLVMAIEYRLGGEAHFPAAMHDCNAAVRFLRAHAKQYSIDPQRIGAVGGSAGGHLVGLMAAAPHLEELQGEGGHAKHSSALQAAIVMAGPMQMLSGQVAERSRNQPEVSNANRWIGKTIDQAPELYKLAAPFQHFNKQSPPLLFMVGEHDAPQRNKPTREKLAGLGVPTGVKVYADGKHGCWNQNPWFGTMVADMDLFFQQNLQGKKSR